MEGDAMMLEDGSAIVNPAEDTTDQGAFNANLANLIPDDELQSLAGALMSDYEYDKDARSDWLKSYTDGLDLLGFKSMLGATGPIGATIAAVIELATAPKVEAKEVMQKRSMEDEVRARLQEQGFGQTGPNLLTQMQNDPQNIGMANGGVASIFNMTKPIGR